MCFQASNVGSASTALAQQQAAQQQAGMGQLNRIFQTGGTIGTGAVTGPINPSQTYYDSLGNPVTGAQAQGLANQGILFGSKTNTAGFTPQFYQGVQDAYVNYANPQLTQQYQQTNKNLGYQLANQGLTQSSAADTAQGSLNQALAQQQRGIANQGIQNAQQLQSQVGQEQNTLTNQLIASSNPGATSQQALNVASQFSAPSAFAPVGNFFNTWSQLYGANSLANSYASLTNPALNPYLNPQLSNPGGAAFSGALPGNSISY